MSSLLEIDSVIKSYDRIQVLTDIYFKCETGEIIGLIGRNGTGKSTLLKILFGTLSAERKFIRIDNRVVLNPYLAKNKICYLPQDDFIPRHLKVVKAVTLFLEKEKVDAFFDDTILQPLKESKIGYLAGGELRYLEIKLLINTECKFIMLDEPFNGVSPIIIDHIKQLLLDKSKTKGIILTDHDYNNVVDIATRLCLIFDGGIKHIQDKIELVKWGYLLGKMV